MSRSSGALRLGLALRLLRAGRGRARFAPLEQNAKQCIERLRRLNVTQLRGASAEPKRPFCDRKQKGNFMRIVALGAVAAGLVALAACNNTPAENKADAIEQNAENTADALEEQADNATTDATEDRLENQADAVRDQADNTTDAIRQGDGNVESNTAGM